ncbi:MAG: MmgE/PrpD family protein, partial [Betaproteobacteria bacterium]|nr:MmgE/PrpD family protein [Betaproteobacteria bacterium]
ADAAAIFGRHFAHTGYDDIPTAAVDAVKKSILDTLGVALAATTLGAGGRELAELAKEGGGKEEGTIWGFGGRVPAWMAAWVNGGLAHSLDFDDVHYEGPTHPSGAIIPAAFAVAEAAAPTSGKDFITAIALGHDMLMRMTSSMLGEVDLLGKWLSFPLFAVFAVSATSAKLLNLDHTKTQMAIGASLAYATGAGEIMRGNLRGLYDSWAAMGGVLAALMAKKGIS